MRGDLTAIGDDGGSYNNLDQSRSRRNKKERRAARHYLRYWNLDRLFGEDPDLSLQDMLERTQCWCKFRADFGRFSMRRSEPPGPNLYIENVFAPYLRALSILCELVSTGVGTLSSIPRAPRRSRKKKTRR